MKNYKTELLEKLPYLEILDEDTAELKEFETEAEFFAYEQKK